MFENVKMPEGLSPEVLEHLVSPKNYGKLDNPSCVGVAVDEKTGEYVIFYAILKDDIVEDVSFATNGCQDTVVVGSMFTEMIKGQNTDYANKAIDKMAKKFGNVSKQQQVCIEIVLNAFVASMLNYQNLCDGKEEEMHVLKMEESCDMQNQPKERENV